MVAVWVRHAVNSQVPKVCDFFLGCSNVRVWGCRGMAHEVKSFVCETILGDKYPESMQKPDTTAPSQHFRRETEAGDSLEVHRPSRCGE